MASPSPAPLLYSIGEVARELRVSPATIRLWEREALLQPSRSRGKHRLYTQSDLERLQRICHLRRVERLNVAAIRRELGPPEIRAVQPSRSGRQPAADGLSRRLRELRRQRGMTLAEVSRRTGLSPSFLSAVESGKSGIAMGNLLKLAHLYGASLPQLQEGFADAPGRVTWPGQRPRYVDERTGLFMEDLITDRGGALGAQLSVVPADTGASGWATHSGEEMIYVLEGSLDFWVGEHEFHRLETGAAIRLVGSEPHRWWNTGDGDVRLLWVWANLWGAHPDGHTT